MSFCWKRTLRTESSERFLALQEAMEVAAVDLHYLKDGRVAGTVILLRGYAWDEERVRELLRSLDEDYLPEVDLTSSGLIYTVVIGEVWGNYEAEQESTASRGEE
jgi:hypothetical protein